MLLKQVQIFHLPGSQYLYDQLTKQLEMLIFQPCLPSLPMSAGWISPIEEPGSSLVEQINNRLMICMQIEERLLPSAVVRQEIKAKVKQIETEKNRKLGKKEKSALKDEVVMTLLPKTFSKLSRIYAYIDVSRQWLVLGTTQKKRSEQFLSLFKKTLGENVSNFELKKISPIITEWVAHQNYPDGFSIEKKGVLQDPNQKTRIIRCQQQDLFADSICQLIKDGCELKQLSVIWKESIALTLSDDFTLRSIKFMDELIEQVKDMEPETKQQKFMADFFMMSESFANLLSDLLKIFTKQKSPSYLISVDSNANAY